MNKWTAPLGCSTFPNQFILNQLALLLDRPHKNFQIWLYFQCWANSEWGLCFEWGSITSPSIIQSLPKWNVETMRSCEDVEQKLKFHRILSTFLCQSLLRQHALLLKATQKTSKLGCVPTTGPDLSKVFVLFEF